VAPATARREEHDGAAEVLGRVPRRAARATVYVVAALVAAALGWAALAEIDVVVTAPARAIGEGGFVRLQAPEHGTVARVAVGVGDELAEGDLVVALDSGRVQATRAGRLVRLAVAHPGEVVSRGDVLAEIAPKGAALVFEAWIDDRDRGLVGAGSAVAVRVHAFPREEHGVLRGRVAWIEPLPVERPGGGLAWRALVRTERTGFDAPEGERAVLPGMGATCDVHVGRRRVLDYVLGRARPRGSAAWAR